MASKRSSWNSGRAVGPRSAFTPAQTLRLLALFETEERWHDLALLATGVDTMLRSSDLLRLRVRDVLDGQGRVRQRFHWRQKKSRRNVRVGLTPAAQQALTRWITASGKTGADYLFTRTKGRGATPICYTSYCRAVKSWAKRLGLDPAEFSSHSLRRTKPRFLYQAGCPVPDISKMLGHKNPDVTLAYLGITDDHILAQSLKYDIFAPARAGFSEPASQSGQLAELGVLVEHMKSLTAATETALRRWQAEGPVSI